jgi:hypothetical protein
VNNPLVSPFWHLAGYCTPLAIPPFISSIHPQLIKKLRNYYYPLNYLVVLVEEEEEVAAAVELRSD